MNVIKLSDQRSSDQCWQHHSADSTSVADLRSSTALTDTWEIGSGCHTQTVWNDKGEERRRNRWRGRKSHLAFTPAQLEQLQWAADIWRESYMSPWPSSPQLRSNYGSGREREREREIEGKGFRGSHSLEPPILLCILKNKHWGSFIIRWLRSQIELRYNECSQWDVCVFPNVCPGSGLLITS